MPEMLDCGNHVEAVIIIIIITIILTIVMKYGVNDSCLGLFLQFSSPAKKDPVMRHMRTVSLPSCMFKRTLGPLVVEGHEWHVY